MQFQRFFEAAILFSVVQCRHVPVGVNRPPKEVSSLEFNIDSGMPETSNRNSENGIVETLHPMWAQSFNSADEGGANFDAYPPDLRIGRKVGSEFLAQTGIRDPIYSKRTANYEAYAWNSLRNIANSYARMGNVANGNGVKRMEFSRDISDSPESSGVSTYESQLLVYQIIAIVVGKATALDSVSLLGNPGFEFPPEFAEGTSSAGIWSLLDLIDANFQKHLNTFVLGLATEWKRLLKTLSPRVRKKYLDKTIAFLHGIELYIEQFEKDMPASMTLIDTLNYVRDRIVSHKNFAEFPLKNLLLSSTWGVHVKDGKLRAQICELTRDKNSIEALRAVAQSTLSSFTNYLEREFFEIPTSPSPRVETEVLHSLVDVICLYTSNLFGFSVNVALLANQPNSFKTDLGSNRSKRDSPIGRPKYISWNSFIGNIKEIPYMMKVLDLQSMLKSARKSLRAAWLTIIGSDPKDIAIDIYGDLLPFAEASKTALYRKCFQLVGTMESFQSSSVTVMEQLIRTLLKRATDLECYKLRSSDPIAHRMEFLLSMVEAKRRSLANPDDPLNIARKRMLDAHYASNQPSLSL